ncbi:MAG: FkbM family methyltransferase [Verrucomicrobiota bacterium]
MPRKFGLLKRMGVPTEVRRIGKRLFFAALGISARPKGELITLGKKGIPWAIRGDLLPDQPFVLSAGLSDEVYFEEELLERYESMRIYGMDPTPLCGPVTQELIDRFGEERFMYRGAALGGEDGEMEVWAEKNEAGEAIYFYWGLIQDREERRLEKEKIPVLSPRTIAREEGVTVFDLLKIDIEGAEYDVIDHVLGNGIEVRQLLVEFHYRFDDVGLRKTLDSIRRLKRVGYRIEWVGRWCEEFLFVKE